MTKNPSVTALAQFRTHFRFLIAELGLSPSSRGRLDIPAGGPPSKAKKAAGDDLLD